MGRRIDVDGVSGLQNGNGREKLSTRWEWVASEGAGWGDSREKAPARRYIRTAWVLPRPTHAALEGEELRNAIIDVSAALGLIHVVGGAHKAVHTVRLACNSTQGG